MVPDSDDDDDWGLSGALASAKEEEDDGPPVNVVSNSGLAAGTGTTSATGKELPYETLLNAAVAMVKTGKLSLEEYAAGVKKLDVIADNALKVYAIPAIKKDIAPKLSEDQGAILFGLEAEIHNMKAGLARLLAYPQTMSSDDLEEGHKQTVAAMHAIDKIQKKADAEREAIKAREKEEKARRAQKAAEAAES